MSRHWARRLLGYGGEGMDGGVRFSEGFVLIYHLPVTSQAVARARGKTLSSCTCLPLHSTRFSALRRQRMLCCTRYRPHPSTCHRNETFYHHTTGGEQDGEGAFSKSKARRPYPPFLEHTCYAVYVLHTLTDLSHSPDLARRIFGKGIFSCGYRKILSSSTAFD